MQRITFRHVAAAVAAFYTKELNKKYLPRGPMQRQASFLHQERHLRI